MVVTSKFFIKTKGRNDIQDITDKVQSILSESGVKEGNILCFVSGSTASLTTIEYEPGLLKDLPEALENIAPMN